MPTVLLSAPYMMSDINRFRAVLEKYSLEVIVAAVTERLSEQEIIHYSGKFDGAICGDDQYSEAVMKSCLPRLKVISKWGTGIDSIDLKAASRLGIRVGNTPNAFTLPVSDSVMGYILAFARRLPWLDQAVKSGRWEKIPSISLSECTLGVIGVGNVGKAVIRRARAFGMKLLGNDILQIAPDFILENNIEMSGYQDLLQRSDFISVNCNLNPSSYHLVNSSSFDLMKTSSFLINTARGPIVDEEALIHALVMKKIAGAALDVFETEPLPSTSPLLHINNVFLAAHNANSSPAAWARVHRNTIHNLLDGLGISHDDLDVLLNSEL